MVRLLPTAIAACLTIGMVLAAPTAVWAKSGARHDCDARSHRQDCKISSHANRSRGSVERQRASRRDGGYGQTQQFRPLSSSDRDNGGAGGGGGGGGGGY